MPDFLIQAANNVDVDADGDVAFWTGRYDDELIFSIEELEAILKTAKRHKEAYQAFKDTNWEDESAYNEIFFDKG